jgi:hypothetical protein
MPPKVDITADRTCRDCGVTKPPGDFAKTNTRKDADGKVVGWSLRPECKDCASKAKAAKKGGAVIDSPSGALETVADFMRDTWTLTEGKDRKPVIQKYVRLADVSAAFVERYGTPAIKPGKIEDADSKVAMRTPAGKTAFVAVVDCLRLLGVKECTKCGEVKRVGDFSIANGKTGQLRGGVQGVSGGSRVLQTR